MPIKFKGKSFKTIAEYIKEHKRKNHLTYRALGEALEVDYSFLHRVINAGQLPKEEHVIKALAKNLKLKVDTIWAMIELEEEFKKGEL